MIYRKLGATNITLSQIGFGGASISGEGGGYGFGDISEVKAIELLHYAYEKGINLFDTAPIYGFTLSEKRMGIAFKNIREKVFIVSKSGVSWHDNQRVNMTNDPSIAEKMLNQTLIDLKSDYVDLYMVHWPDKNVDIRDVLTVYKKAQDVGKIKHIGLCNTNLEDLEKAKSICKIEAIQAKLNFFDRENLNLMDYLTENKISFMSWGTLDQGILSGKMTKNKKYDKSDARSWAPWWDQELALKKTEKLNLLLSKLPNGKNGIHLGLSYNLSFNNVVTALCGARSIEQLDSLLTVHDNLLSTDELNSILNFYNSL